MQSWVKPHKREGNKVLDSNDIFGHLGTKKKKKKYIDGGGEQRIKREGESELLQRWK